MAKYPKLILFIAGVAVILVAVLVETRNGADTGDWPVYRNDKYGFTIKYPPGWKVSESGDLTHDVVIFSPSRFENTNESIYQQNIIDIYETHEDEIVNFLTGGHSPDDVKFTLVNSGVIEMKKISVGRNSENRLLNFYVFGHNGITYVFSTHDIFEDQMINSFTFFN